MNPLPVVSMIIGLLLWEMHECVYDQLCLKNSLDPNVTVTP